MQDARARTLQAGDRRIRAVVRPVLPADVSTVRHWPCSSCDSSFDVTHSHAVLYAAPGQAVPYAFMVCPPCADVLVPIRVELDPRRLETVVTATAPRAGRGPDGREALRVARAVHERVRQVLAAREGPPPDVVVLRAVDLHELAAELGRPRTEVLAGLRHLDVLVAMDPGSAPLAAPGFVEVTGAAEHLD